MRIGYVLTDFPVLSETFIRREINALCCAGHRLFVYAARRHHHPLVPEVDAPRLVIREVPFQHDLAALTRAVQTDGIEHLHSGLMLAAQRVAYGTAGALEIPFTL